MTIPIAIFGFGVISFLISLPITGLAFVFGQSGWWIFLTGLAIGAAGLFCIVFGVFLKLASLLFRA